MLRASPKQALKACAAQRSCTRSFSSPAPGNNKSSSPLGAWISPGKKQVTEWQRKLQRDAQRSNLWEMKQLRTFPDGKAFPAQLFDNAMSAPSWPTQLMDLSSCSKTPINFKAELVGKAARNLPVSFVAVSQKRVLVKHVVDSWMTPLAEKFPELPKYDIIILQNWMYRLINPMIRSQWEQITPGVTTLYKRASLDLEPEVLGVDVENSLFAYFFVVENATQKIRWRAVGQARVGELETLQNIILAASRHVK
eukprot:TRINITY_DN4666_c0_g1_i1.p1 TRINITY_DN4666_c0_g1~~TRINITY_DN4666_c0_g1_i1.p1  ORF type:complete len:252 (+),score=26.34 TRINITY_DN4666_c0_g1_i1:128-883(+)